ncbi:SWIM zinc finger family protein [Rhizohabitans arisaemae]|uniref:SWIM zinc finger family protein n=1 Tax=Rhizohabitans arisaemae TaxID=2720610 RepID=UPI0024B151E3|nr:SWIM zinc finger family protein [Rhizohabitans arisaemae]
MTPLIPAAPQVVADAVESLTGRLKKKLDGAVEQVAALPRRQDGGTVHIGWGEDAVVTLDPAGGAAITTGEQATCSCLLAPRCLHRAAVLSACPIADDIRTDVAPDLAQQTAAPSSAEETSADDAEKTPELTAKQREAAAALWEVASALPDAGLPGAGAVLQAELLRAAHGARRAGLPRAEALTLTLVTGIRNMRDRRTGHRLADLTTTLCDLLLLTHRLAAGENRPDLVGTVRRPYRESDGGLRVHGLCSEPVATASGYGGVVTHLIAEDGRRYTIADVRPGMASRARGARTSTVALGSAVISHAELSRGGLLIAGATVSADGRLGAGQGVRATPLACLPWTEGAAAGLFAKPPARAAAEILDDEGPGLLGCDVEILGAEGDRLVTRLLGGTGEPDGPIVHLVAANPNPALAHQGNLRMLAGAAGTRIRVLGTLDPARSATLLPLAVAPVPGAENTLTLPADWKGHADLGYDLIQMAHLPPGTHGVPQAVETGPDPLAEAPLWRVRRLVELGVSAGRRGVAEAGRGVDARSHDAPLRRAGFATGAELGRALTAEAARRTRDVFGRSTGGDRGEYARTWLAAALYVREVERDLVRASWGEGSP